MDKRLNYMHFHEKKKYSLLVTGEIELQSEHMPW